MTRTARMRPAWKWTISEAHFYRSRCVGSILHVCCGESMLGDVRVDKEVSQGVTVLGDYRHLPFKDESFDTVICDPAWGKRERLDLGIINWLSELRRVARHRIIIVHNTVFSIPGTTLVETWCVNAAGLLWKVMHVHVKVPPLPQDPEPAGGLPQ